MHKEFLFLDDEDDDDDGHGINKYKHKKKYIILTFYSNNNSARIVSLIKFSQLFIIIFYFLHLYRRHTKMCHLILLKHPYMFHICVSVCFACSSISSF